MIDSIEDFYAPLSQLGNDCQKPLCRACLESVENAVVRPKHSKNARRLRALSHLGPHTYKDASHCLMVLRS